VPQVQTDWKSRIDAIEEAYEFFLAYAAQGLSGDQGSKSGGQLRDFLSRMAEALDGLADVFGEFCASGEGDDPDAFAPMTEVLRGDAAAALAAVRVVATRPSVSSQLVDNLNANIHLRAVLTDIFLLDEASR